MVEPHQRVHVRSAVAGRIGSLPVPLGERVEVELYRSYSRYGERKERTNGRPGAGSGGWPEGSKT